MKCSAAIWKTVSGAKSATGRRSPALLMSPSSTVRWPRRPRFSRCSRLPSLKSSTTRTSAPASSNASTRWEPMNPAPPVTRTRSIYRGLPLVWHVASAGSAAAASEPATQAPGCLPGDHIGWSGDYERSLGQCGTPVHRAGSRRTPGPPGRPGSPRRAEPFSPPPGTAPAPALGQVRQEAQAGEAGLAAAGGPAAEVIAGDPQPRAGDQHVVRPVPARPGVQPGGAGGVLDQRPARRAGVQARQAGRRYRPGAGLVALELVVEPAVVAGHVDGIGVGRRR